MDVPADPQRFSFHEVARVSSWSTPNTSFGTTNYMPLNSYSIKDPSQTWAEPRYFWGTYFAASRKSNPTKGLKKKFISTPSYIVTWPSAVASRYVQNSTQDQAIQTLSRGKRASDPTKWICTVGGMRFICWRSNIERIGFNSNQVGSMEEKKKRPLRGVQQEHKYPQRFTSRSRISAVE